MRKNCLCSFKLEISYIFLDYKLFRLIVNKQYKLFKNADYFPSGGKILKSVFLVHLHFWAMQTTAEQPHNNIIFVFNNINANWQTTINNISLTMDFHGLTNFGG